MPALPARHDRDRDPRARRAGGAGAASTRPVPQPAAGEVLVKVAAAGVNRPDVMQRQGHYPPPPGATDIPGLEIAGEVVALGAGVTRWKVGDKVMALVVGGGYAEYCPAHESHALPVPAGLSHGRGRRDPRDLLHRLAQRLRARRASTAGETLLVHGGSSGIGTTAIQLAKAFGARVIATAGSAEKCEACRKLGADVAINYKTEDFVAATKEATGGKGADVILDMVGGDYIERNYEAAAIDGRIVQIAFQRPLQGHGRFPPPHAQAADPHRLDAARALGRGQGRDRPRGRGARAAADRGRQGEAGDRQHLPAARGRGRARPMEAERAYRQDRAGGLTVRPMAQFAHAYCAARRARRRVTANSA